MRYKKVPSVPYSRCQQNTRRKSNSRKEGEEVLKGCESESKIGFLFISWGEFFFMTSFNKKCRKLTIYPIRTFVALVKKRGNWMNHAFKSKKRVLKLCLPILFTFNQLHSRFAKWWKRLHTFSPFLMVLFLRKVEILQKGADISFLLIFLILY